MNGAEWCQQHAAAMAAWWCLVGIDAGIVAAVNYAAVFGAGGVAALPRAVADAITVRLDPDLPYRDVLAAAVAAIANRANVADRVGAEAALIRMCRTVREALPKGARERLEQRLCGGDVDFWLRCRRAAAVFNLGGLRGREDLREQGMRLALLECFRYRHLTPSVVLATVGDLIAANTAPTGTIDRAGLETDLEAEWVRAGALLCYPDDDGDQPDWSDIFNDDPGGPT